MNLMRWKYLYFAISLLFLIPGLVFLMTVGLRPAVDFTGGSLLEVRSQVISQYPTQELQTLVEDVFPVTSVQQSENSQVLLRGKTITNDAKNIVLDILRQEDPETSELRFTTIGPTLGQELLIKMITAVAVVAVLITLYIWRQFKELKFGVCAVLAMLHDSLILLGSFSFFGWWLGVEVDVLFVTAVLTTLSFSVHDTIVVYDRIRELSRKHHKVDFEQIVNTAVLETLSRSINNSVTIIIMLVSLSVLGGESIRWFAVALLIGAITGTYSSTFTAAPLLLLWDEIKQRQKS